MVLRQFGAGFTVTHLGMIPFSAREMLSLGNGANSAVLEMKWMNGWSASEGGMRSAVGPRLTRDRDVSMSAMNGLWLPYLGALDDR